MKAERDYASRSSQLSVFQQPSRLRVAGEPDARPCSKCYAPVPCRLHGSLFAPGSARSQIEVVPASPLPETWLPSQGAALAGSFFNATETVRLVEAGLVEPDADYEFARRYFDGAAPDAVEGVLPTPPASDGAPATPSAPTTNKEGNVPAATAEKPKEKKVSQKDKLAAMSKTALRKFLLAHQTISDSAWAAWREKHGVEAVREKGESRADFIARVLS